MWKYIMSPREPRWMFVSPACFGSLLGGLNFISESLSLHGAQGSCVRLCRTSSFAPLQRMQPNIRTNAHRLKKNSRTGCTSSHAFVTAAQSCTEESHSNCTGFCVHAPAGLGLNLEIYGNFERSSLRQKKKKDVHGNNHVFRPSG